MKSRSEINLIILSRNGQQLELEVSDISPITWYEDVLPFSPAIIGEVLPGLPAYQAGLLENDKIISVDGEEVENWYEMREKIAENSKAKVTVSIDRDGKKFDRTIVLGANLMSENEKMIGITQNLPVTIHEKYGFFQSIALEIGRAHV